MSLLFPAALGLLVLAVPIIFLYLLRLRRREVKTSSTLLWTQLILDRSANAPWQKLHRNILLLLQLLILAALAFALARPIVPANESVDGNVIILIDQSASMSATDESGGASRFDVAIGIANQLIENLGTNDTMTIITAGNNPAVLAASATDRNLLRQTISTLTTESGAADWSSAFAIAAGLAQSTADPRFVVISDGGIRGDIPQLPGEVTYMPVGRSGENLAITSHGTRRTGDTTELLVDISNFGESSARATVSVYADDRLYDSRAVEFLPQENAQLTWTLPENLTTVETRLVPDETSTDYLPLDNSAWSVSNNRQNRNVYLVSEGNLFIERIFSALPGYDVTRSSIYNEASTDPQDTQFDLFIFDGVPLPDTLPAGNILIIDPQPPTEEADGMPLISVSGIFTDTTVTEMVENPILENVGWREITIAEARDISAPSLTPLVIASGGPLLHAGEIDGHRVVVLPFDLAATDLPLQIAFPVLMANITGWLDPGGVLIHENDPRPGDVVTLVPDASVESVVIESPQGDLWESSPGADTDSTLNYRTNEPGIYTIYYEDAGGELSQAGQFGVNLANVDESNILPGVSLQLGTTTVASGTAELGIAEIWPVLLIVALIFLMIEWRMTYRRPEKTPLGRMR